MMRPTTTVALNGNIKAYIPFQSYHRMDNTITIYKPRADSSLCLGSRTCLVIRCVMYLGTLDRTKEELHF